MSGTIRTARLLLVPATVEHLDALLEGNGQRLGELLHARTPEPLVAPPLTDDAIPFFRDQLRSSPGFAHWPFRWIVDHVDSVLVGSAGCSGPPDADGAVLLGYSVYPAFEGRGYATEAARALVADALVRPGVERVRATIPPWHAASQRVAAKAGMTHVGEIESEEDGRLQVWERMGDGGPEATDAVSDEAESDPSLRSG